MFIVNLRRVLSLVLAAILLTAVFVGCTDQKTESGEVSVFTSFREIPGITQDEISAIEELQRSRNTFRYSSVYGTEMFVGETGRINGFSALFCRWLSELFAIPFVPSIVESDKLIIGLENGTIDFTGELAANDEHRMKYYMTSDIAQRHIITLRMYDSPPFQEIAATRALRYAVLDDTNITEIISRRERNDVDFFSVNNYLQAYAMLKNGEVDAFITESSAEAAFGFFDDVVTNIYYPILFTPVSLATQNPELKPIIDVVQKALNNGAIQHLINLYNQGHQEYLNHKFQMLLTDEEREYIKNNPIIPYVAENSNYPLSFFESRTNEWGGISIDVLHEIEKLTGISFERINNENTNWSEILYMLESGQASLITSLIQTDERIGDFIWPGENFVRNHPILVSKSEFRDVSINEILYIKVGTIKDTAHGCLFKEWFPNHMGIIEYLTTYDALDALESGEVDMVMVSEHQLLILTNYREQVGYKANFVFDYYFYSTFGLNKDRTVLSSIITKAMYVIDVEGISGRWLRRTYDYRVQMAQERVPYMIGAGMFSVGFIFAIILLAKKRREGLRLKTLVDIRTKELSESVMTAQEASRAKSDFLSSMSHEIRTPMNAIIGMAELLGHEQLNERQMGYVGDITVSSKSLLGIINDILDFSKIESGKLELNPVDYELITLINNIDSMFTYVAQKKALEFKVEFVGDLPDCLYGDDMRLRQALTNICGNAVKFTEKGYIKLTITANPDRIIFRIEDTGMGIREEDIPKLFKAFEQLDKVKNRSVVGTGLGLSITKAFVGLMGGEITVESEYGRGTAFTISIPVIKGNAENIRKSKGEKNEHSISAPDAMILVTDDNEFNLKVASGLLSFMDIEAETADSGAKAIELVQQKDYDIIFMDHMMPEMDGVEAVRRIRELGGKYEKLTIIALTANAILGAREMFLENGFDDFISKPINADELQEIIQKHLPPDKIRTADNNKTREAIIDKEDQLRQKAIITFGKENLNTFERITGSLSSGDIKTAHRIAHTLKSSAGYLGKKELQEAAFALEQSLQCETPDYTPDQLDAIGRELEKALREFEPLLKSVESDKQELIQMNDEEFAALLMELKPLLENSDFNASAYAEKLQGIAGLEKLGELIDDYDFEGALNILNEKLSSMG